MNYKNILFRKCYKHNKHKNTEKGNKTYKVNLYSVKPKV